jgi:hypothetical protein
LGFVGAEEGGVVGELGHGGRGRSAEVGVQEGGFGVQGWGF